jgi:hypothetical protein
VFLPEVIQLNWPVRTVQFDVQVEPPSVSSGSALVLPTRLASVRTNEGQIERSGSVRPRAMLVLLSFN